MPTRLRYQPIAPPGALSVRGIGEGARTISRGFEGLAGAFDTVEQSQLTGLERNKEINTGAALERIAGLRNLDTVTADAAAIAGEANNVDRAQLATAIREQEATLRAARTSDTQNEAAKQTARLAEANLTQLDADLAGRTVFNDFTLRRRDALDQEAAIRQRSGSIPKSVSNLTDRTEGRKQLVRELRSTNASRAVRDSALADYDAQFIQEDRLRQETNAAEAARLKEAGQNLRNIRDNVTRLKVAEYNAAAKTKKSKSALAGVNTVNDIIPYLHNIYKDSAGEDGTGRLFDTDFLEDNGPLFTQTINEFALRGVQITPRQLAESLSPNALDFPDVPLATTSIRRDVFLENLRVIANRDKLREIERNKRDGSNEGAAAAVNAAAAANTAPATPPAPTPTRGAIAAPAPPGPLPPVAAPARATPAERLAEERAEVERELRSANQRLNNFRSRANKAELRRLVQRLEAELDNLQPENTLIRIRRR